MGLANLLIDNWFLKLLLTGVKRVKGNKVKQKLPITTDILKGIHKLINLYKIVCSIYYYYCITVMMHHLGYLPDCFLWPFAKSHLRPIHESKYNSNNQFSISSFRFFSCGALIIVTWSKTSSVP